MILLSVGTQLPFDRLVSAVDRWAAQRDRDDIVAQVGPATYQPTKIKTFPFVDHDDFRKLQSEATLMISHAGMGSIITAMELGIPIIILARDHRLGEHRNGHQMATLRRFRHYPGVFAAEDEAHLAQLLDRADTLSASPQLTAEAPESFIAMLNGYIEQPLPASRLSLVQRWLRGA